MICVGPAVVDGVTYLVVEPQTSGCSLGVLLVEGDASTLMSLFSIPPVADLSTAFWLGFNLVGVAALTGWALGAVLNFVKEK